MTDARKGVRNVLKSFWRKPREELPVPSVAGGLRYKIDRIEAQILLLADTCFIAKVGVYLFFMPFVIAKNG